MVQDLGLYRCGDDGCTLWMDTREVSVRQVWDTVVVDVAPDRVWRWLTGFAEHYLVWHPDHVSAVWEQGEPNQVGSVLKVVEYLGGHREVLRFEMTEVDPPRRMGYRILGSHGVLLPGGAFTITADDGGSRFTASIQYRFGVVTEWFFRQRVAALRTHMREEGENLKRLVEADD
jgi:uncharacterized protein YndB with AHSA1/START domain